MTDRTEWLTRVLARAREELGEAPLSTLQLLVGVSCRPDRRPIDLARELDLSAATVHRVTNHRLVSDRVGSVLVAAEADPDNRRFRRLSLTDAGRRTLERILNDAPAATEAPVRRRRASGMGM